MQSFHPDGSPINLFGWIDQQQAGFPFVADVGGKSDLSFGHFCCETAASVSRTGKPYRKMAMPIRKVTTIGLIVGSFRS
jgi:hypothetical protein